jgi:hypothetical protein
MNADGHRFSSNSGNYANRKTLQAAETSGLRDAIAISVNQRPSAVLFSTLNYTTHGRDRPN